MSRIQIESVASPFNSPELAVRAVRLLCRAETLGFFEPGGSVRTLDGRVLAEVWRSLARSNIARDAVVELLADAQPMGEARCKTLLDRVYQSLEDCPSPADEWKRLLEIFPPEELAALLGISPSSLRRYAAPSGASEERATPDEVADRLHFLALVIDALAGSYNAFGIRRWFARPFAQLQHRTPRELMRGAWHPGDPAAQQVRALADELMSLGAT